MLLVPCTVDNITSTEHAYGNIIPSLCADRNFEFRTAYYIIGYIRIIRM